MSGGRHLDLFSGVGGFSLGMEAAGFETVAFSEIEPFPCKVLAHRWPDVPNLGDIREITEEHLYSLGEIDVVTFGSPCQDFSVAGKRLGMQGERSSLFHEAIRVIRQLRGGPRFAIFENVPGLFSSASGWDFACVLDELAESGALDIAWSVLDAQWFGVPQRRRRIFVVADFRGERAGEILSISEGVCRYPAPSRETGQEAIRGSTPSVEATLGGGSGNRGWADDTDRMTFVPAKLPEVAGGLTTRYGKGVNTTADDGAVIPVNVQGGAESQRVREVAYPLLSRHDGSEDGGGRITPIPEVAGAQPTRCLAVRRLTPLECERLMGWPDGHTDIPGASDSGRYRACGNGVVSPVVEWIARRMANENKE